MNTLIGHSDRVNSVIISPNELFIVSGSWDNTINIWDIKKTDSPIRTLIGHNDYLSSVAISLDNKLIVSGSADFTAKIWDFENGRLI